jgi:hypothetical protein
VQPLAGRGIVVARALALIYYDRVAGTWHLERLYD